MPANPNAKKAALKQKVMAMMTANPAMEPMMEPAVMPTTMPMNVTQPSSGYVYGEQDQRPLAAYKMGKYVDAQTGAEIDPMSKDYKFGGRAAGEYFDAPPLPVTSGKYSKKK